MKKILTPLILLSFAAMPLLALDLVKDGKPLFTIVRSAKAPSPQSLAEKELAAYIGKITGIKAPGGKNAPVKIVIGTVSEIKDLPKDLKKKLSAVKRNDAFAIRTSGKTIYVAGNNPLSALYGTYELLERMGVRWFYDSPIGEHVPRKKTLSLPTLNIFQKAVIPQRTFNVCGNSSNFAGTFNWMLRNKMHMEEGAKWQFPRLSTAKYLEYRAERGYRPHVGGHLWASQGIPNSLFKTHPEYFVLKKGVRTWKGRVERCYSNKNVQAMAIKYYLNALKKNPDTRVCVIAHDDSAAFCDCEPCKKMGTYNGKFSISNYFHKFWKIVLDEVVKSYPDAQIEIFAYWNYRPLPEDPSLRYPYKNAYILYASHQRCYAHDYHAKEPCNKFFVNEMTSWQKRGHKMGLYDYRMDAHNYYAPLEFVMAEDARVLARMKAVHFRDETITYQGARGGIRKEFASISNWQNYYVAAKLLWNPAMDENKLLAEAYDLYYGESASEMKKYHALRRKLWDAAPGHCAYNGMDRVPHVLQVPGAEKQLKDLLKAALAKAKCPLVKKRIEQDAKFLDLYWVKPAAELKKRLSLAKDITPFKAEGPIKIDGKLNETSWLKASVVRGFMVPGGKVPVEETVVRILYDKENLYIGVNAENKHAWNKAKADAGKRDGAVWSDDSIELQIQPPNKEGAYYHFIINTIGTVYDSKCVGTNKNADWNSNIQVKVGFVDKTYNYEIKIPFKDLGFKVSDQRAWRFHAIRTTTNLQPPATREFSSLDGQPPFLIDQYRKMIFSRDYVKNGNFAVLSKQKIGGKMVSFPKNWSVYGGAVKNYKVTKTASGHELWTNGVLACGFGVPKVSGKNDYNLTIRAKGKGNMEVWTWSWVGYNPRSEHRRLKLGKVKLTDKYQDYTFKMPHIAKEYYVIWYIGGNKTISSVSCTLAPAQQ